MSFASSGHVYYFLEDVYPRMTGRRPLKTPGFVKALFPTDDPIVAPIPPPAPMQAPQPYAPPEPPQPQAAVAGEGVPGAHQE